MPQTAKGSALVAGSKGAGDMPNETKTITALRGFRHPVSGEAVATGAVITLPAHLARELIATNKAVVIASPLPAPETDPAETESATAEPRGRGRPPKKE